MLPGVPPITEDYPVFKKFLPWGPFYGVFVHKDSDEKVHWEDLIFSGTVPEFKKFVEDFGAIPMNVSGNEANRFLKKWQSVTTWLLHDAGATKVSPATYDIPRPK